MNKLDSPFHLANQWAAASLQKVCAAVVTGELTWPSLDIQLGAQVERKGLSSAFLAKWPEQRFTTEFAIFVESAWQYDDGNFSCSSESESDNAEQLSSSLEGSTLSRLDILEKGEAWVFRFCFSAHRTLSVLIDSSSGTMSLFQIDDPITFSIVDQRLHAALE